MSDNAGSPEGAERDALLPCPFCGGEARIWDDGDKGGPSYWSISCQSADCAAHLDHYFPDGPEGEGRATAIAAWNRRARVSPDGGDQPVAWLVETRGLADVEWHAAEVFRHKADAAASADEYHHIVARVVPLYAHPPALRSGSRMDEIADEEYTEADALAEVQRVRDWMEGQDFMAVERTILDRALRRLRGFSTEGVRDA